MNKFKLSKLSDRELVNAVIQGNESAIGFFFYEKYTPLFKYLYNGVAANKNVTFEDLVQELYLHLSKDDWARLKTFDEKNGALTNWLSTVVRRLFRDKTASMIDSASHSPIEDIEYDLKFEDQTFKTDRRIMVSDVMKLLDVLHPPRYGYVLKALMIEGYKADEVAKELGVTIDNFYNIKKRALEQLYKLWELWLGEKIKK